MRVGKIVRNLEGEKLYGWLEVVKRHGYGRAGFDLLKAKMIAA